MVAPSKTLPDWILASERRGATASGACFTSPPVPTQVSTEIFVTGFASRLEHIAVGQLLLTEAPNFERPNFVMIIPVFAYESADQQPTAKLLVADDASSEIIAFLRLFERMFSFWNVVQAQR